MVNITIVGYVSSVSNDCIVISGVDPNIWDRLPPKFFSPGIRRRVTYNKKTCTVKFGRSTKFVKKINEGVGGAKRCCKVGAHDMKSCYCTVSAYINYYSIPDGEKNIEGWTIRARSVQQRAI